MAGMNIDDSFLRDTRVIRLAKQLGWSRRETMGCLLDVYAVAYDRAESELPPEDIDIAAGIEGFADRMVGVHLADHSHRGIRIRGAEKRIRYLKDSEDSGRVGGLRSAEVRRRKAQLKGGSKAPLAENEGHPSKGPQGSGNLPVPVPVPSPVLLPVPVLERVSAKPTSSRGKARKSESGATPEERATALRVLERLSAQNGIAYRSEKHVDTVVARLRDGVTELELRCIVAYCAVERGWKDDPKMAQYLRPSTLFGPEKVHEYRDPAVSWAEQNGLTAPRPQLELGA